MKKCRKCKEIKPLDKFGLDKSSGDNHNIYCRRCTRRQRKERHIRLGIFNDDPRFLFRAILYLGKKKG